MSNIAQYKKQCLEEIERAYKIAEEHFGRSFVRPPKITFKRNLKVCAGKAVFRRDTFEPLEIRLSLPVLELNAEEFVNRTPGHEAAHLIAIQQYGIAGRGHSPAWKNVMRLIGRSTAATHSMEVARKGFRYVSTCGKEFIITTQRHNKIQRGYTYRVAATGGQLTRECFMDAAPAPQPKIVQTATPVRARVPSKGKKQSKAAVVRAQIAIWKREGRTLESLTQNEITELGARAGYQTQAKTHIKNIWNA